MDKYLEKKLSGNLYFLEPDFFAKILINLGNNLVKQGFEKVYIITGHGGMGQTKALSLAGKKLKNLIIINPYDILEKKWSHIEHAGEYETSLFWACYPEEETKSRKIRIKNSDDYFRFLGYDPRVKASLALGNKMLRDIAKGLNGMIK